MLEVYHNFMYLYMLLHNFVYW